MTRPLAEDEFYIEAGKFVLTERFHLRRGACCGNGCRHCPFNHQAVPEALRAKKEPPRPYFDGLLEVRSETPLTSQDEP